MATLGEGIYAYLKQMDLIADGDTGRIYPQMIPQNAVFPLVTWQIVSGPSPVTTHSDVHDVIRSPDGFMRSRVQFSCWAESERIAELVGDHVYAALEAFGHGLWGELTVDAVNVLLFMSDHDEKRDLYRRLIDVMIGYTLTIGS